MHEVSFADVVGEAVTLYGSRGVVVAPLALVGSVGHVVALRFAADALLGAHVAPAAQLFVVTDGHGWVMGPDGEHRQVRTGDAVWWDAGDAHAAGSEEGMTALVIESPAMARA